MKFTSLRKNAPVMLSIETQLEKHAMQGCLQMVIVQEGKARGLASSLDTARQLTFAKLSTISSAYMSDPASLSQRFTVTALALAICSDAFSVTSAYGKSYLYLHQSIQGLCVQSRLPVRLACVHASNSSINERSAMHMS